MNYIIQNDKAIFTILLILLLFYYLIDKEVKEHKKKIELRKQKEDFEKSNEDEILF